MAIKNTVTIDGIDTGNLISQISIKGTKYELQDTAARDLADSLQVQVTENKNAINTLTGDSNTNLPDVLAQITKIKNELETGFSEDNGTDAWATMVDLLSGLTETATYTEGDKIPDGKAVGDKYVTSSTPVKTYVDNSIAALDADVTSTGGKNVTVKVVETDGKVSGVTVTETDIASASTVASISAQLAGISTTVDGATDTTVKTYVDTQVAGKNVTASGDTDYVTASAANNSVAVGATSKVKNAVAAAETSIQSITVNGQSATISGDSNAKAAAITITGANIATSSTDSTTVEKSIAAAKTTVSAASTTGNVVTIANTTTNDGATAYTVDVPMSVADGVLTIG